MVRIPPPEPNRTLLRRLWHEERVEDLREGRRNRAQVFRARRGKGSYRRRMKHAGVERD